VAAPAWGPGQSTSLLVWGEMLMRSGLEGAPLGKELAGWMLLISSGDLMFSCLHTAFGGYGIYGPMGRM